MKSKLYLSFYIIIFCLLICLTKSDSYTLFQDQPNSIRAVYKYGKFSIQFQEALTFLPKVYANSYELNSCSLTNNNFNLTCYVISGNSPLKILTTDADGTTFYYIYLTENKINIGVKIALVTPPVFRIKIIQFPKVSGDILPNNFNFNMTALLIPNNNFLDTKTVNLPMELNGEKVTDVSCKTSTINFGDPCTENYVLSCSCSISNPVANGDYK